MPILHSGQSTKSYIYIYIYTPSAFKLAALSCPLAPDSISVQLNPRGGLFIDPCYIYSCRFLHVFLQIKWFLNPDPGSLCVCCPSQLCRILIVNESQPLKNRSVLLGPNQNPWTIFSRLALLNIIKMPPLAEVMVLTP